MKSPKAKKRSRKAAKKLTKSEDAEEATDSVATFAPQEAPQPMAVVTAQPQVNLAATSARSEAARRTADGKFTKAVFNHIGGTEYPRFASGGIGRLPKHADPCVWRRQ